MLIKTTVFKTYKTLLSFYKLQPLNSFCIYQNIYYALRIVNYENKTSVNYRFI